MVTSRSQPEYRFDFCGGHLAVDFTNTVGSRGSDPPEEHLATYGDLLAWAEQGDVLSRDAAARLRRRAEADPEAARAVVRQALALREALYAVLARTMDRGKPDAQTLARLNEFVASTYSRAQLVVRAGRLTLHTAAADTLDAMLPPVVRAAVDLVTSDDVRRVGRCADPTCMWLFYDTTRSGTRRWCDMKVCGNRNKVRRFRAT